MLLTVQVAAETDDFARKSISNFMEKFPDFTVLKTKSGKKAGHPTTKFYLSSRSFLSEDLTDLMVRLGSHYSHKFSTYKSFHLFVIDTTIPFPDETSDILSAACL